MLGNKEAEFFLTSGKKLWDAKQYKKALNNFEKIYEILPEAAYWIGCCYYYGLGVPKNIDTALKYFEKGAQLGWIECNVILGTHYQTLKHLDGATHYFTVATKKGREFKYEVQFDE
jgi:TPR repeat protein